MKNLVISPKVEEKLSKKQPPVTRREVEQCFENIAGGLLIDKREKHKTNPPTLWFIARTNADRELKVVYLLVDGIVHLKSSFDPDDEERRIYQRYGS